MRKILSVWLCALLTFSLLAGCGEAENDLQSSTPVTPGVSEETQTTTSGVEVDFSENDTEMFTDRDGRIEYDESDAIKIELTGNSAKVSDNSVKVTGSTVTITKDATHVISGTLSDGMIIIDAPDTAKLQLVFNGVEIYCSTSSPLYIKQADKVFVTLSGENSLENGGEFTAIDENNIDAVIFSKQDLTFNGDGSLEIISPAGHGIVGKDDLVFCGGSYSIVAASHTIDANDSIRISDSVITADAGKDGLHCENSDDSAKGFIYIESGTLTIESEGDGISAGYYLQITGGEIDILAGGGSENGTKESSDGYGQFGGGGGMHGGGMRPGARISTGTSATYTASADSSSSMKGIKAENSMLISGGSFNINSADDGIHSNLSAEIKGGSFVIASGDDAIHAEESLTVTSGKITITESYEGLEALHIAISGGEISLVADDDGLNAAGGTDSSGMGGRDGRFGGGMSSSSGGSVKISGGTIYINASGDGIDANGTLEISGGYTTVIGPTQGDTATLDYDKSGTITGGTFIGTGASNMAQTFSSSSQGVIAVSVGNQSAKTKITIKDKNGKEIVSYAPELSYQVVIISTPELKSGESYTVSVGSESADIEAN